MLTVHSKSIGIHLHMPMIADGIGVPMDKLRLVQNHTGGTFGYKFSPTNEAILGVAALVCPAAGLFELQHVPVHHLHRQAQPGLHAHQARGGRQRQGAGAVGRQLHRPRPVLRVRRPADPPPQQFVGAGFDIPPSATRAPRCSPTTPGARPSAPTVRHSPSWAATSPWTLWPRSWGSTPLSSAP